MKKNKINVSGVIYSEGVVSFVPLLGSIRRQALFFLALRTQKLLRSLLTLIAIFLRFAVSLRTRGEVALSRTLVLTFPLYA